MDYKNILNMINRKNINIISSTIQQENCMITYFYVKNIILKNQYYYR